MLRKIVLVALGIVLLHATVDGKLYKWVDEKGSVHFSDQPPPPSQVVPPPAAPVVAPRARSFRLPQHGDLVLSVPDSWDHQIHQPPENLPPTIELTPSEGDDFKVLITPMWSFKNEAGFNSRQASMNLMSAALSRAQPTAVEKDVRLKEIKGRDGIGYYFFVTDRNPGPSYPYMVQCAIGVGDLHVIVTVLCRTRDSEGLRQMLLAIEGAGHRKG